MSLTQSENIPSVVIYNNLETFYEFLDRTNDETVVQKRLYRGDRALLWLGKSKLVFATASPQHLSYLQNHLGYAGTSLLTPDEPSAWLSRDILREDHLLVHLVEYAGPDRKVQLIPYATTPHFLHLADVLRNEYGLTVTLPESPTPQNLWLRDYVDTKSGFRVMMSTVLRNMDARLPQAFVCKNIEGATSAACWFLTHERSCIVKADIGEGSLGHYVVDPSIISDLDEISVALSQDAFLKNDLIIVEEFIQASHGLSPSLEFFVPPHGEGSPQATYLANQLFLQSGGFAGVLISRELEEASWVAPLREAGLAIASQLQSMGYVGHFDLDAVVDDDNTVYLLEINARRTGGTHTHEFACHLFGEDYLERITLISQNKIPSSGIAGFDELLAAIGDLQYPIQGAERGVVITTTSALEVGEFGCVIVASTTDDAMAMQKHLMHRINRTQEFIAVKQS